MWIFGKFLLYVWYIFGYRFLKNQTGFIRLFVWCSCNLEWSCFLFFSDKKKSGGGIQAPQGGLNGMPQAGDKAVHQSYKFIAICNAFVHLCICPQHDVYRAHERLVGGLPGASYSAVIDDERLTNSSSNALHSCQSCERLSQLAEDTVCWDPPAVLSPLAAAWSSSACKSSSSRFVVACRSPLSTSMLLWMSSAGCAAVVLCVSSSCCWNCGVLGARLVRYSVMSSVHRLRGRPCCLRA